MCRNLGFDRLAARQRNTIPHRETRALANPYNEGTTSYEVIFASELVVSSPTLGAKTAYSSGAIATSREVEAEVVGAIHSPFEPRLAVILATATLDFEHTPIASVSVIGSHLTAGFQ